ncbi:FHA domain-containing protein [Planctomycetota bacterium]
MEISIKIKDSEYVLPDGITLIGRKEADIIVASGKVSGTHARFIREGDKVFIEDLGSRNGTFVNGRRIEDKQELTKGDTLKFGDAECSLVFPPSAAAPTPKPAAKAAAASPAAVKERQDRAARQKESRMIKNLVAAAIVVVIAFVAYSMISNYVPPELEAIRIELDRMEPLIKAMKPQGDQDKNRGLLDELDGHRSYLTLDIPENYGEEYRRARRLLKQLETLAGKLLQENNRLAAQGQTAERLAELEDRFNTHKDTYDDLVALARETGAFANAVMAGELSSKAADLDRRVNARLLVLAREALDKAVLEIDAAVNNQEFQAALTRLDTARSFPYPAAMAEEVSRLTDREQEIRKAGEKYFDRVLAEARRKLDNEQYDQARAMVEEAHMLVGFDSLNTRRDKLLAEIETVRKTKLEAARRLVAARVVKAEKLFAERKFGEAFAIYDEAVGKITNADLKKELSRKHLESKVYMLALDEVIAMLTEAGEFDLSKLGEMSGLLKKAARGGCEVASGETTISMHWKAFNPAEFIVLMKTTADRSKVHAALVCGLEGFKAGRAKAAGEWIARARLMSSTAVDEFEPVYAALLEALQEQYRKEREARLAKAEAEPDKPDAIRTRRQGKRRLTLPGPGGAVYAIARPRLFMRADKLRGTDIPNKAEFMKLASKGRRAKLKGLAMRNGTTAADLAGKYIFSKDKAAADRAIAMLQRPGGGFGWYNTSRWLVPYAIAYDWLYDYPGFTPDKKAAARKVLVRGLEDCMSWTDTGGRHIASNCFWIPYAGAIASAIALYGEEPIAKSKFKILEKFLNDDVPPIFHELNGTWPEGWSYYVESLEWLTTSLEMFRSFTGRDLWRLKYKDDYPYLQFARGFLWGTRGDHTFIRYGDTVGGQKASTAYHVAFFIQACIRSTQDGELMWWLNEVERVMGTNAYTNSAGESPYLYHGMCYALSGNGPKPVKPKGLSIAMGYRSQGTMIMRSGWDRNAAFISFRCGDYLGPGHSDFDNGHFDVFAGKGLLIDSGQYASIGSPHYTNYHKAAIAHNVILAGEPGPNGDEGGQRYIRRGTLHTVNDMVSAGNAETGTILAFEDNGGYVYAAGDVSRAYNKGLSKWTRELVYIRPNILVVLDRVKAGANTEKRFLLHTVNQPQVRGRGISIDNQGHMEIVSILPQNGKIRVIGGKGKEYWAKGRNWTQGSHASASYDQPGAWRAEIYQEPGSTSTLFLTAMTFGTTRVPCRVALKKGLTISVNGRTIGFGAVAGAVKVK